MLKRLLLITILSFPIYAFAQQIISADFQNEPLTSVIRQLEANHGLVFSFSQQLIDNQFITTNIKNKNLTETLTFIFQNTNIVFKIVNDRFIVLKKADITEEFWILCGTVIDS